MQIFSYSSRIKLFLLENYSFSANSNIHAVALWCPRPQSIWSSAFSQTVWQFWQMIVPKLMSLCGHLFSDTTTKTPSVDANFIFSEWEIKAASLRDAVRPLRHTLPCLHVRTHTWTNASAHTHTKKRRVMYHCRIHLDMTNPTISFTANINIWTLQALRVH